MSSRSDPDGRRSASSAWGTHVIVLPGGGYAEHAAHETEPIVGWLNGLGVRASVFNYPLLVRHPEPLHALRAEIHRLRDAGAERVGLIGFSAGGHLAGLAALAPGTDLGQAVDFVVLGYAITSMETETEQSHARPTLSPTEDTASPSRRTPRSNPHGGLASRSRQLASISWKERPWQPHTNQQRLPRLPRTPTRRRNESRPRTGSSTHTANSVEVMSRSSCCSTSVGTSTTGIPPSSTRSPRRDT